MTKSIAYSALQDTVGQDTTLTLTFTYGLNNQRIKTVLSRNTTVERIKYFDGDYEEDSTSTGTKKYHYINAPTGLIGIFVSEGSNDTLYHVLSDHLGSLNGVINAETDSVTYYSFNAWGMPRDPDDWTSSFDGELFAGRGYTGHEHLLEFNLINMNGRVYDPVLGRFLSPDPYVQAPGSVGSFNRYAYCFNNPLVYTDPSGEIVWFVPIIIGAALGGFSGYMVGEAAGATGWEMAGYIAGGALIGGASGGAALGVSAAGGGAMLAGAAAGAMSGGGFTALNGGSGSEILQGAAFGAIAGFVGGGVGSAIGGGWGALAGGASSNLTGQLLYNDGDFSQVNWGSVPIAGGASFGIYHAMSASNYLLADKKVGLHEVTYRDWNKINADMQRSMFWKKENGGYIDANGNVSRVERSLEHAHGVEFNKSTAPPDVVASYHTHWQSQNRLYSVMPNRMDRATSSVLMNGTEGIDYFQGRSPAGFTQMDLNNMSGYNYLFTRTSTYGYLQGSSSQFAFDYLIRFFLFPFHHE